VVLLLSPGRLIVPCPLLDVGLSQVLPRAPILRSSLPSCINLVKVVSTSDLQTTTTLHVVSRDPVCQSLFFITWLFPRSHGHSYTTTRSRGVSGEILLPMSVRHSIKEDIQFSSLCITTTLNLTAFYRESKLDLEKLVCDRD
jgi:hypothetical protein